MPTVSKVLSDKGKDHCDLLHQTRVSCEDVFHGNLIPVLIFGMANSERREYGYYQNPDCRIGKMTADAHSENEIAISSSSEMNGSV